MSPLLLKLTKVIGWLALGLALFIVNMVLLWNFSFIRRKVKIENASTTPVFQVVVMESGKPQLFLFKEELDDYLKTHSNYSFLLPAGQDQVLQDQIVASYNAKFGIHGGKGYPTFKRETIAQIANTLKCICTEIPTMMSSGMKPLTKLSSRNTIWSSAHSNSC